MCHFLFKKLEYYLEVNEKLKDNFQTITAKNLCISHFFFTILNESASKKNVNKKVFFYCMVKIIVLNTSLLAYRSTVRTQRQRSCNQRVGCLLFSMTLIYDLWDGSETSARFLGLVPCYGQESGWLSRSSTATPPQIHTDTYHIHRYNNLIKVKKSINVQSYDCNKTFWLVLTKTD